MTGSGLLQYIALEKDGRGVCHERSEIANGESRRAGTAVVGHRLVNYPYQDKPSQTDCYTDADWAGDVGKRFVNDSWNVDAWDSLA